MTRIVLTTLIRAPVERVFDLARDLDAHKRSLAHTDERIVGGRSGGLIELGEEVEWEARHLGLRWRLRSRITEMVRPRSFTDEQVTGPFASFRHRHDFEARDGGTLVTDTWEHRAPLGPLGVVADALFLRRHMRRLLETRNATLRAEAERGG